MTVVLDVGGVQLELRFRVRDIKNMPLVRLQSRADCDFETTICFLDDSSRALL